VSFAEITFYTAPEGSKGFVVEADDISEKAKIEITVSYDPVILANPRVTLETGTVTDVDDSTPGTLVFRADQSDEPAPSFVAHLSFDITGDALGGIHSVKGKIMEPDGTITPSRAIPNIPNDLSTPNLLATFSGDGDMKPSQEVSATEDTAALCTRHDLLRKREISVVQRFREFRGKREVEALVALFGRGLSDMIAQEPPVALSDGKTPVCITLQMQQKGGNAPNVALSDAKLLQVRKDGEKKWLITALPNQGTWNASLIIQTDEYIIEFPLVVAPKVEMPQDITRRNFIAELDHFISELVQGGKGENDPLRRSLYEYFFTANYLASLGNYFPIDDVRTGPICNSNY
jgi:hypothetical protein